MEHRRAPSWLPAAILRLEPAAGEPWPTTLPPGVMVDLTDFASLDGAALARVEAHLALRPSCLLLRIGGLSDAGHSDALSAGWRWRPDGIVLAGCGGRAAVQQAGARLAVLEAEAGLGDGVTRIVAEPGPMGLLDLAGLHGASGRLAALAWDAGTGHGGPSPMPRATRRQVQAMLVLAGAALSLPVIDTAEVPAPAKLTRAALLRACRIAARRGFVGKVATSADQAVLIADAFTAR